jgi:hypothetical protein
MAESGESAREQGTQMSVLPVLDYILLLRLTEARWERIDGILAIALEAAVAGDLGGLHSAMSELQAVGPVRVIRIGGAPVGPPPPKVREREDELRRAVQALRASGRHDEDGDDDDR